MTKVITGFPDDLMFEILSYVTISLRVDFAKINKELTSRLLKKIINVSEMNKITIAASIFKVKIFIDGRQETRSTKRNPIETILQEFCPPDRQQRDLKILNSDFEDLPVISSLNSIELDSCHRIAANNLHVSCMSNLSRVSLVNCRGIVDVRSLGNVRCLTLDRCERIQDISSLNNNYEINILYCPAIRSYSKSFQNSIIVHISSSRNYSLMTPLDPVKLLCVKKLKVVGNSLLPTVGHDTLLLPPNLELLHLEGCLLPFSLPKQHKLQTLIVRKSPGLSSCQNMSNIKDLTLQELTIEDLEGLGNGNPKVKLIDLNIRDLGPLQSCRNLLIKNLKLLNPTKLLGVTHVVLTEVTYPSLLPKLNNAHTVRKVTIMAHLNLKEALEQFIGCSHIYQIIIGESYGRLLELFQSDHDFENEIKSAYCIEKPFQCGVRILTRR